MFVRLLIASLLIVGLGSNASADQEPSFVLTVKEPTGGKASLHAQLADTLRAQEPVLRPKLLERTKTHPASRMNVTLKLQVAPRGLLKANAIEVSYRNAKGPISDDSIKPIVEDALKKTKPLPKELVGATVDVTIAILQP